MSKNRLMIYWQFTNIFLTLTALLLIITSLILFQKNNRYTFEVINNTRELYVFDKQAGKLFITSPEIIRDYGKEMWTVLSPTEKGKTMPFKDLLDDKAGQATINLLLEEARKLKENNPKD